MDLIPGVTLVLHPVDTEAHPTVPAGWRWAVMAGTSTPPGETRFCCNAGWCPTEAEAALEGEMVAACAVKVLRMFGVPAAYNQLRLDRDPIPAGHDQLGAPV